MRDPYAILMISAGRDLGVLFDCMAGTLCSTCIECYHGTVNLGEFDGNCNRTHLPFCEVKHLYIFYCLFCTFYTVVLVFQDSLSIVEMSCPRRKTSISWIGPQQFLELSLRSWISYHLHRPPLHRPPHQDKHSTLLELQAPRRALVNHSNPVILQRFSGGGVFNLGHQNSLDKGTDSVIIQHRRLSVLRLFLLFPLP